MVKRVSSAAMVVAVLAIGAPVWAETPMTPLRPTVPATAPAGASSQWVEPPAAAAPKTASSGVQPKQPARQTRTSLQRRRSYARHYDRTGSPSDHMARQLNRQALRGVWYGGGAPYDGRYGPAPRSDSGD